jgi:hypothetical protein
MSIKNRIIPLFLAVLLAACNLTPNPSPVQPTFPVPNQTMTALFSTPFPTLVMTQAPGSATETQPAVPSQTALPPTDTSVPPSATPTVEPSETPVPTQVPTLAPPTATPDLSRRTITSVAASRMSTAPTIDGDWNDLPSKEYPAEIVVYGAANWKSRNDLAASFKIGWDATYLYLGVKVSDDVYVQNATGANLFKGDSLEILLDTDVPSDYYVTTLSPDDFQLGISPGRPNVNGTKEAYLWLPANLAGSRSQVKIASLRNDAEGITRIEVAIPWALFGVTPASGDHYGFVLSVSDNDNPASNVQQSMVSNVKTRVLTDPTTWGDLTLK